MTDFAGPPCRCGLCCEVFQVEATAADALREPRIAELGAPVYRQEPDGDGGQILTDEVTGYVLSRGALIGPCLFLQRDTEGRGVCTIYATRPNVCRWFDCQGEGGRRLVALGYAPRQESQ